MLTNQQIQQIDSFFEKNGLSYFDLRQEFVDHVSEAIEQKMKPPFHSTFETAFDEEVKKFNRKDLLMLGYDKISEKELSYQRTFFKGKKLRWGICVFLFLCIPFFLLPYVWVKYLAVFCYIVSVLSYLVIFIYSKWIMKRPVKKLSLIPGFSYWQLFTSALLLGWWFYHLVEIPAKHGIQYVACLSLLFLIFTVGGYCWEIYNKWQDYEIAKKRFPFLFEK